MGKVFLVVLITLILLNESQAKGKRSRKARRNATDILNPRSFQGIPVKVPLPSNRTTETDTFIPLPTFEVELQSNDTAKYLRGPLSNYFIPIVYIIAIIVGIPANIAILFAIGSKVRVVSSAIFYCSLAASDLLLLFSLVLKAHYHFNGNHWIFGEYTCRITTACFYGNLYCSTFTLACISIKRYVAVVHPFLYKSLPKRAFSTWGCLIVWIVFIVALLPEFVVRQSFHITHLGIITCHDVLPANFDYRWLIYYNIGLSCVGFFLPLVVTGACYTSIVWHLNRSHRDWALYIRASTFNFVIFLLCFGPSSCFHFAHYVLLSVGTTESLYIYFNVAVCLCCLHSALDPFLFFLMSTTVGTKRYFLTRKGHALSIST